MLLAMIQVRDDPSITISKFILGEIFQEYSPKSRFSNNFLKTVPKSYEHLSFDGCSLKTTPKSIFLSDNFVKDMLNKFGS